MPTARERAMAHLSVTVQVIPVSMWLRYLAARTPRLAKRAMAYGVAHWHALTVRYMPVRASVRPGRYRRQGRGMLRKTTHPSVTVVGANALEVRGGLKFGAPYAIWLIAGTRAIAGGAVLAWRPGDPTITTWPAKEAGGGPMGQMPVALPWRQAGVAAMAAQMRREWRREVA